MIIVGDVLVSDEIVEACFSCDLSLCWGHCCVEGDAGAPLEPEEVGILQDILPAVEPYMHAKGREAIQRAGLLQYDEDGAFVTPLVNQQECAFAIFEEGKALCAIEKAWKDGTVRFRKPLSCHLYPIRVSRFNNRDALNYHHWPVCDPARAVGKKNNVPLSLFCQEALIRKYGAQWYEEFLKATSLHRSGSWG